MDGPLKIAMSPRVLLGRLLYTDVAESLTWSGRHKKALAADHGPAVKWISKVLEVTPRELLQVKVLETHSPDLSLRAFHFCKSWGVPLERSDFISARALGAFLKTWEYHLYLSADVLEVYEAATAGVVACIVDRDLVPSDAPAAGAQGTIFGYLFEAADEALGNSSRVDEMSYPKLTLTPTGIVQLAETLRGLQNTRAPARVCIEWDFR